MERFTFVCTINIKFTCKVCSRLRYSMSVHYSEILIFVTQWKLSNHITGIKTLEDKENFQCISNSTSEKLTYHFLFQLMTSYSWCMLSLQRRLWLLCDRRKGFYVICLQLSSWTLKIVHLKTQHRTKKRH